MSLSVYWVLLYGVKLCACYEDITSRMQQSASEIMQLGQ
jgi:hypothetical protein